MSKKLSDQDLKSLQRSLQLIQRELDFVVRKYHKVVHKEFRKLDISEHWSVVRVAFDKASKTLPNVQLEVLQDHGLIGLPLDAKLIFLEIASKEVHRRIGLFPGLNTARKLLAWLLGVVDNLLESLATALPPLCGVTEFKIQVKSGLEYPEAND